ncbi:hypothetical protein L596_009925 [Steinernema carpocapsae]|nr:hypothetical protein L596_009925 [Steinernema carpocapsae]
MAFQTVVLLLIVLSAACALECYNYPNDDKKTTTECTGALGGWCSKVTSTSGSVTGVARACMTKGRCEILNAVNNCSAASGNTTCCCNTKLCNGATATYLNLGGFSLLLARFVL